MIYSATANCIRLSNRSPTQCIRLDSLSLPPQAGQPARQHVLTGVVVIMLSSFPMPVDGIHTIFRYLLCF